MKVSIIIPAYNSEKYIERCLHSIILQSYQNLEIIVVNDGSNDNTLTLLEKLSKKDQRIQIIDQLNMGTLMARLKGIEGSTGDVVLNLDADDYLEMQAVELLVEKMCLTNADIVIANHFRHAHGRKKLIKNYLPETLDKVSILKFLLTGKLTGYIWGRLIKRQYLEDLNLPFNKAYTEDLLINFYIFSRYNIKLAIVEDALTNYIIHDNNISQSTSPEPVEGFFDEYYYIEEILEKFDLKSKLIKELNIYQSKNWVVYCRKGGKKSKDAVYHKSFYKKNYPLVKRYLPFYQRIEMMAYAKNVKFGRRITDVMKLINRYSNVIKFVITN